MHPKNTQALATRVAKAAAEAVKKQGHVTAIDVMIGIGWLSHADVLDWRKRRVPFLERVIHTNLKRISVAMRLFAAWARQAGLRPSPARSKPSKGGGQLRFSKSGEPAIEDAWRTHWVSRRFAESGHARPAAKAQKPEAIPPDADAAEAEPAE